MGAMTEGNPDIRELEREAAAIRAERERLKADESALEERTKVLLGKMPTDLNVREMAHLVGLSHQRVAQLVPGRAPRGRRAKAAQREPDTTP